MKRPRPVSEGGNRRQDDGNQAGGEVRKVLQVDRALSFRRAQSTARDQAREPPVRLAVGGEQNQRRSIERRDLGADQQVQAVLLGRQMRPDDARQRVAVRDR
jgi:hypothetical protein